MTSRALIVVDVQNDFCEGGSLAVAGGEEVARRIAEYLVAQRDTYPVVAGTRDWHVDPGPHFAGMPDGPDFVDSWPVHCVAGSEGAASHPALDDAIAVGGIDAWFLKGERAAAFSGFEGRLLGEPGAPDDDEATLAGWLRSREVSEVDVVGIATDYCVKATALDAVRLGFVTRVLLDLTAGVAAASTSAALEELATGGVVLLGEPVVGG